MCWFTRLFENKKNKYENIDWDNGYMTTKWRSFYYINDCGKTITPNTKKEIETCGYPITEICGLGEGLKIITHPVGYVPITFK